MRSNFSDYTLHVLLAGSSQHSLWCLQSLLANQQFEVVGIVTPSPKPQGRSQELVPNALHAFAQENAIPVVLVENSLTTVKDKVLDLCQKSIDILLVVDFGYLIPDWLLELPRVAPLNIHPSRLPEWRGSSPGQFVLLNGATHSAISLIKMDTQLDHGPIVAQLNFPVDPSWNATNYYTHAFQTITKVLPSLILDLVNNQTIPQQQLDDSSTPLARKLNRQDGFVPFSLIHALQHGISSHESLITQLPYFHQAMFEIFCHNRSLDPNQVASLGKYLCQIPLAFSPWPTFWTELPTKKGNVKMSIMSCTWNDSTKRLDLHQVHIAGQQPAFWNQVKNISVEK